MGFFTDYLTYAQQASSQTGWFVSVVLSQWADETAYGGDFAEPNNIGNVGVFAGGPNRGFPTIEDGVQAYISVANQQNMAGVKAAAPQGWRAQAIALGNSPWAGSHYNASGGGPGSDLISIIENNNLTQYDGPGAPGGGGTSGGLQVPTSVTALDALSVPVAFSTAYPPTPQPPVGFASDFSSETLILNGTTADVILGDALISAAITYALTQVSTVTLTIHDPKAEIINLPEFAQTSLLEFGGNVTFSLVSVDKQGSTLTATFQPWAVAALKQTSGPFTVAPNQITRTEFAQILVTESVDGLSFIPGDPSSVYGLDSGYAQPAQEQLSRGTVDNPLEDTWTCLQRLANEVQWICFEYVGNVYFGPYASLANAPAALAPVQFTNGIETIDGTWDVGQPLSDMNITAIAGAWTAHIGQSILIQNLGPFSSDQWIVSKIERDDADQPDITITLQQPLPSLPEPKSGGAQAAVGVGSGIAGGGNVQSSGGGKAAVQAVQYALSKVGDPYSEASSLRTGPNSFDCSGLVFAAYQSAGVTIGSTTGQQWPNGAGASVPAGIGNLQVGDLLFFAPPGGSPADANGHVVMVTSVGKDGQTVNIVEAANSRQGVITDTFNYPSGMYGSLRFFGATRPAP